MHEGRGCVERSSVTGISFGNPPGVKAPGGRFSLRLNDCRLKGGRLLARLKGAAAESRQAFIDARESARVLVPSASLFAASVKSDPLKADRLKAGGIKPGTW